MGPLEPIPETVEALAALSLVPGSDDLLPGLVRLADRARAVAPDLVGVSISRLTDAYTFTLVASDTRAAALDAVQYVDGGPCVAGARDSEARSFISDSPLDEERWRLFAEATAASSVRATLTLPLRGEDGQFGTVNLYGSSARAFDGRHTELAEIFGAFATHAITNGDLGFTSLSQARSTPDRIRDDLAIGVATGLLAVRLDVEVEVAEQRLFDAAARADVPPIVLAQLLIDLHAGDDPGPQGAG